MMGNENTARFRGFFTPPPNFRTPPSPSPASQWKPPHPHSAGKQYEPFHVVHKVPAGDSPYVRAKHVQLIDKDPSRAVSLFWQAINAGDRVESALKDMALVMKQLNRTDEAIEAIKSFRHLSPTESQDSIDNILIELYKRSSRVEEEIELLEHKLKKIEEGIAYGGKQTKTARSQGKKVEITIDKEYSRLLGNLAWAHMQLKNFKLAEENYRKALSFEPDRNKQCNLAICLMHMNRISEAKFLLQSIRASSDYKEMDESCHKSLECATEVLAEVESKNIPIPFTQPRRNNSNTLYKTKKKLSFEHNKRSPSDSGNWRNVSWEKNCNVMKTQSSTLPEIHDGKWRRDPIQNGKKFMEWNSSPIESSNDDFLESKNCNEKQLSSAWERKKSWADMVEEDEFNDENANCNIICKTPSLKCLAENISQCVETLDLNGGYYTQPEQTMKHNHKWSTDGTETHSSPWHKQLNFDGAKGFPPEGDDFTIKTPLRNRLQVFRDITP